MHRQFLIKVAQNREYRQNICTNLSTPFQYACLQRYDYKNPKYWSSIHNHICYHINVCKSKRKRKIWSLNHPCPDLSNDI